MERNTLILGLSLSLLSIRVSGYCFGAGYNPWWSGPPIVEQLSLTSVRVSWHGLLQEAQCADNIMVKHFKGINSNDYKISDPLDVSVNTYIVHDLSPNQEYTYQVIAREEKGLLGVDYNRGEKTRFTTSKRNRQQGLEVKQDDPIQVRMDPKPSEQGGKGRESRQGNQEHSRSQVSPVYSDNQRTKAKVAGLEIEVLMGVIVAVLVVTVIGVGLLYNCFKKKGPEKDLELNSSMYADDDEDEDGDEDGDGEEEDKFEDSAKDGKKYDMMVEKNRTEVNKSNKLTRPMSVA